MRYWFITLAFVPLLSASIHNTKFTSPPLPDSISYSNPALIMGTDFGTYVQLLVNQGQWTNVLAFVSEKSRKQFGDKDIMSAFQNYDWGFNIKLKSIIPGKNTTFRTLNYEAQRLATRTIFRLDVMIENDSCKLVIRSVSPLTFH